MPLTFDEKREVLPPHSVKDPVAVYCGNDATAQVFEEGEGRSRFVWITDVLPDAMAAYIAPMMEQGGAAMKAALEGRPVAAKATAAA